MSLASEARDAVRKRPFLYDALRAGVVNYRAAADLLDLDGDPEAVATALRRFATELDPMTTRAVDVPVRMQSGVRLLDEGGTDTDADADTDAGAGSHTDADAPSGSVVDPDDVVVSVGAKRVVRGGDMTAVRASGDVDANACEHVLARLDAAGVVVDAAGVVAGNLVVVVPRRQGATALRVVEDALSAVPSGA